MQVSEWMKTNVVALPADASVLEAVNAVKTNRISLILVTDREGRLVGVVTLRNLLSIVMPDFVKLGEDFGFVHDFGAVKSRQPAPEDLIMPLSKIMQNPISVMGNCSVFRANAMLFKHGINDLPIVDEQGKLIGIASHADISIAMMAPWGAPAVPPQELNNPTE
jgi:CBS domain-containing protein